MANTHSITLNGSSQYLSRADSATLSITGDMTVVAYGYMSSLPGVGIQYTIASKYGSAGNRSWWFQYANSGGTKQFQFRKSNDGTALETSTVNYNLSATTWYQLAVVWTASTHTAEFFVNGVSVGSDSSGSITSTYDSTADFIVGAIAAPDNYWTGNLDDIQLWNTTRTGAQLLATLGVELAGNESGLVGYWKLNNDLTDSTSGAETLTNNGSATFSTDTSVLFRTVSLSDSVSSIDSSTSTNGWYQTLTDTVSTTDSLKTIFGWNNQNKNTGIWSNQAKH